LRAGLVRGAVALLGVLALGSLTSCSEGIPFISKKPGTPATPACPVAVVLRPLANTPIFNQTGGDLKPINVAWFGVFSDISATCNITGDTLHASLDNIVVAERGPAARGNDVDVSYFIALTSADQTTVLGKKSFSVHVTLPDKAKRGGVSDHVEVAFATGGRQMSDLNITVGLLQTPDAIEFYKHFRGR
jgi:hypothetical protein